MAHDTHPLDIRNIFESHPLYMVKCSIKMVSSTWYFMWTKCISSSNYWSRAALQCIPWEIIWSRRIPGFIVCMSLKQTWQFNIRCLQYVVDFGSRGELGNCWLTSCDRGFTWPKIYKSKKVFAKVAHGFSWVYVWTLHSFSVYLFILSIFLECRACNVGYTRILQITWNGIYFMKTKTKFASFVSNH